MRSAQNLLESSCKFIYSKYREIVGIIQYKVEVKDDHDDVHRETKKRRGTTNWKLDLS